MVQAKAKAAKTKPRPHGSENGHDTEEPSPELPPVPPQEDANDDEAGVLESSPPVNSHEAEGEEMEIETSMKKPAAAKCKRQRKRKGAPATTEEPAAAATAAAAAAQDEEEPAATEEAAHPKKRPAASAKRRGRKCGGSGDESKAFEMPPPDGQLRVTEVLGIDPGKPPKDWSKDKKDKKDNKDNTKDSPSKASSSSSSTSPSKSSEGVLCCCSVRSHDS